MINIFKNDNIFTKKEPGISFFRSEIESSEHKYRQGKVREIKKHLLRQHKINGRSATPIDFKGQKLIPAAIMLQGLKTVLDFHTAFLVGNPVSITGTPEAVELMNYYYRKGNYSKVDWQVLYDLVTYGNAFEYVYMDENGKIKSKVFRNEDSYPIYDDNYEYKYFVEYWKNKNDGDEHFTIYFPDHVDTYRNNTLLSSTPNYTGLPIHYVAMDKAEYDQFGDSFMLDLIPIWDRIEELLSKIDDAVTKLSLNPIGVLRGATLTENDMIDSRAVGAVLSLEADADYKYANAVMDYQNIKHELDNLYQQFNLVAAVPSNIIGSKNVSNVSENSTAMIFQLTENKGRKNENSLVDGFRQRWEKMRVLMAVNGDTFQDSDFDSIAVSFNINEPVDALNDMKIMQMQYNMGAISKRTIIEKSGFTADSAQEIQRLEEEGISIFGEKEAETPV